MNRWVVDEAEMVHHAHCAFVLGSATPYFTKPVTNEEMIEHLKRPEIKDHHERETILVPCDHCILGPPLEEE